MNRRNGSNEFQSIFYGQVLQKPTLFRSFCRICPVSIHLLWTGTLEEYAESTTSQPVPQFQSIFYGQVLQKNFSRGDDWHRRYVSIHLLWTGTLEVHGPNISIVPAIAFQSIFYGQVLQKSSPWMVFENPASSFNPSFMDRYFRSRTVIGYLMATKTVSIHLLWTGTLEVLVAQMEDAELYEFQSIFYGQVLQKLLLGFRARSGRWRVSIHLLWTGTLEAILMTTEILLSTRFNPSFMDRYFRSNCLGRLRTKDREFQSIFYGQVLQKTIVSTLSPLSVLVSIHLLWTGTLEESTQGAVLPLVTRFNPSFMDRYFRRPARAPSVVAPAWVSIHLLWTGTLEEGQISAQGFLGKRFNPSFMDRYFRSRGGVCFMLKNSQRFNPSFMDRYFRRPDCERKVG